MSELVDKLHSFNQQLEKLLAEDDVNWDACVALTGQRDEYLKEQGEAPGDQEDELRTHLKKSLELNQLVTSRMRDEQLEVEKSLLKVNQGKKARASYK